MMRISNTPRRFLSGISALFIVAGLLAADDREKRPDRGARSRPEAVAPGAQGVTGSPRREAPLRIELPTAPRMEPRAETPRRLEAPKVELPRGPGSPRGDLRALQAPGSPAGEPRPRSARPAPTPSAVPPQIVPVTPQRRDSPRVDGQRPPIETQRPDLSSQKDSNAGGRLPGRDPRSGVTLPAPRTGLPKPADRIPTPGDSRRPPSGEVGRPDFPPGIRRPDDRGQAPQAGDQRGRIPSLPGIGAPDARPRGSGVLG